MRSPGRRASAFTLARDQVLEMTASHNGESVTQLPVDERCVALAEYFLHGGVATFGEPPNTVTNRMSLARAIQQAAEDWFSIESAKLKGAVPEVDRG
jgi:hypothetical protein